MFNRFLVIFAVLALTACASANQPGEETVVQDPLEGLNRATFELNYFMDGLLFKPVSALYRDLPPPPVRESFDNFLNNLHAPVNFANGVLQGDVEHAGNTMFRFLVNSTLGIAGLFDVADNWFNVANRDEDFGQTLAVWGMGDNAYVVLPILGPSNTRDSIGRVADFFMDPVRYLLLVHNDEEKLFVARTVMDGISARAKTISVLEDIEAGSVDYYSSIRSLYKQRRDYLILNREVREGPPPLADDKEKTKSSSKMNDKGDKKVNLAITKDSDTALISNQDLPSTPKLATIE